jgi:para-nitrobenzyl esterase
VLAHLVSHGSRGLFQRAIVQSGAFALNQVPLAEAEAFGETLASAVECSDQTASCLRGKPADVLRGAFPDAAIPGVVDGKVLTESIGATLAAGRFARVPILNGMNHDEEWIFVAGLGVAVSGGTFVLAPAPTPATYETVIASGLGVPAARAAAVAVEYPLAAYPFPILALSTLVADASFACPALQIDQWTTARHVPTFAYQVNDDTAPQLFAGPQLPPIATHSSEIQYLLDQPNAPFGTTLNGGQEALAARMRTAWTNFAASGDPSSAAVPWPSFNAGSNVLSLAQPQPQVDTSVAATHHCSFWAS